MLGAKGTGTQRESTMRWPNFTPPHCGAERTEEKASDQRVRAKARTHHHPGVEFLSVQRGKLEMNIAATTHVLDAGDSIYFDSSLPHSYRRVSQKPCSAIVVTVP
jgi:mannose-6-phosphate isomerase-like protein (cupin superfamily)